MDGQRGFVCTIGQNACCFRGKLLPMSSLSYRNLETEGLTLSDVDSKHGIICGSGESIAMNCACVCSLYCRSIWYAFHMSKLAHDCIPQFWPLHSRRNCKMTSRNWKQNLKLYRRQRPVKHWTVEDSDVTNRYHSVDGASRYESLVSNGQSVVKEDCNTKWISSSISRMGRVVSSGESSNVNAGSTRQENHRSR